LILNIIIILFYHIAAVQEFDYNKGIQECLNKHLKIFEKNNNPLHNPDYNEIIKRKIKFIKWILKTIETYPDIEFQVLVTMVDSKIIIYKNKLDKARTRPVTYRAFDVIRHLEWFKIC